ncbi:MAG: hypothetical protein M1358_12565 [Chloroflexi bacterium]|nr:hypothetical protein [Chloroflexota bacterium]
MDAKTARETVIKPKLVEVFGNTIASTLITGAIAAGMKGSSEHEKLKLMVECICANQKVVGMWGASQTERQKREWLNLI